MKIALVKKTASAAADVKTLQLMLVICSQANVGIFFRRAGNFLPSHPKLADRWGPTFTCYF